jgi:hypothetical protein
VLKTGASATTAVTIDTSQNVTFVGSQTFSAGTANGVTFLNGSKVLTSGTALTFDGTNLGVGGAVTGTTGASTNFTVNGSSTASAQFGIGGAVTNYIFNDSTQMQVWANGASTALKLGTGQNNPITFFSNNAEGMRLTSTGLGIGTSSPDQKLTIDGGGAGFNRVNSDLTPANDSKGLIFVRTNGNSAGTQEELRYLARNHAWYTHTGTRQLTLDSSGNLGLGVTPSAWFASSKALQLGAGAVLEARSNVASYLSLWGNAYINTAGGGVYLSNGEANRYQMEGGIHRWYVAPSGTAGNAITFTQAMTLDASGNFMVGTTTPLQTASGRGNITINGTSSSILNLAAGGTIAAYLFSNSSGTTFEVFGTNAIQASGANNITFTTNSNERARITSGGQLLVGITSGFTGTSTISERGYSATGNGSLVQNRTGGYLGAVTNLVLFTRGNGSAQAWAFVTVNTIYATPSAVVSRTVVMVRGNMTFSIISQVGDATNGYSDISFSVSGNDFRVSNANGSIYMSISCELGSPNNASFGWNATFGASW